MKLILYGRSQSVVIGDKISSPRVLKFCVPQGSILGPSLFIMYLAPLQDIMLSHKLNCMFYADDTQIYVTLEPNSPTCCTIVSNYGCTDILRSWIEDVISWNTKNMLKCNHGKTEAPHDSAKTINYCRPFPFEITRSQSQKRLVTLAWCNV